MATLSQIYVTFFTGVVVATGSFLAFGAGVRFDKNSTLTPRAWSRPVSTVKNNLGGPYCISWIAWAIRQRYIDLLAGIPGTGTRLDGWSGPTLRTNLDGIVMLRYHVLLLKVSIVASLLCMLLLLPLYATVPCDPYNLGLNSCISQANLTDFEALTIANVPSIEFDPYLNQTTAIVINGTYTIIVQPRTSPLSPWRWINGLSGRYAAFALTVLVVTWYTCYLLYHEWIECLALRRVYYLEADYYTERLEELDGLRGNLDPEDPFQTVRPPYLPHPEMRETIPNVSLHSVLYQLPDKLRYARQEEKAAASPAPACGDSAVVSSPTAALSSPCNGGSLIDRQLAATVDFFDQCVPNQPGFTSSVVAVTIIPDASLVAGAWIKWYQCGKRLRRLRYLKAVLEGRRRLEQEGVKTLYDYVEDMSKVPGAFARATVDAVTNVAERSRGEMENLFCPDLQQQRQQQPPSIDEEELEDATAAAGAKGDGTDGSPQTPPPPEGDRIGNDGHALEGHDGGTSPLMATIPKEEEEIVTDEPANAPAKGSEGDVGKGARAAEPDGPSGLGGLFATLMGINRGMKDDGGQDVEDASQAGAVVSLADATMGDGGATGRSRVESIYHDAELGSPTQLVDTSVEMASSVFFDAEPETSTGPSERRSGSSVDAGPTSAGVVAKEAPLGTSAIHLGVAAERSTEEHFEYKNFDPQEFAKWIGFAEETQLDQLVDTLGVEQLSVYSREMSQSASNLCVYGCDFKSLRLKSIEELEGMLEDAWSAVREANAELLDARARIFREESRMDGEMPYTETSPSANDAVARPPAAKRDSKQLSPLSISDEKEGAHLLAVEERDEDSDSEEAVPLTAPPTKAQPGLRKRGVSIRAQYNAAQSLIKEMQEDFLRAGDGQEGGEPSGLCKAILGCGMSRGARKVGRTFATALDHPSYAVVTFTSRQAAIAARQCLADGRGVHRWSQVDDIPIAPLADSPPCQPFFCRGFCRPVTLTLNYKAKKFRRIVTWTSYFLFCCLYTIPLALTSAVLNPTYLAQAFPDAEVFQNPDSVFFRLFAGISSGMLYTLFFSVLPQIFKLFANFEGTSSSVPRAENHALRFYWYFMLLTAFTGSTLAQMLVDGFVKGFEGEVRDGLQNVARTIPTQQAPVWLNWILVRAGNTLPMMYLFQFNTWLYGCLRMKCLNRAMRGGGPGGPPPYRIYIDAGTVFMCITSLAPCCPIIAPAATLYYMMAIPILRWLLIFVYRPKYDAGGIKLPYLHEIIISSLILGQILSGVVILLKQSIVPAGLVFALTIPTFFFSQWTKEAFEKSYNDAGLLQTSMLDGWDDSATMASRERYRAWLVDTHKASYVPICLSGGEDFLTSQPAVTVPTQRDVDYDDHIMRSERTASRRSGMDRQDAFRWRTTSARHHLDVAAGAQKGAVFRRYIHQSPRDSVRGPDDANP